MKRIQSALPQGRVFKILGLLLALLLFFVSLELLGDAFELLGEGVAEALIAATENPITGIFVGVLATTMVQSSSTSTSLTVALVAAGTISTTAAVPIMLGANIGTSVTNTIVALGHINNKDEFKRAFTGSLVLDYFNIIAVALFFVVELFTSALSWTATQITNVVVGIGVVELFDPLSAVVGPIAGVIVGLAQEIGWIVLIIAFVLLYASIRYLVKLLRSLLDTDLEEKIRKYLFGSAWKAMLFGFIITTAVQSSSITTSVIIPIIALGVIVAIQALPYFIGANIGTSTTALIAALSLAGDGSPEGVGALHLAFLHLSFEAFAIAALFSIKKIRLFVVWLAEKSGAWLANGRVTAIAYIAAVFYLLPFGMIWLTGDWEAFGFYEPVLPEEVVAAQQQADEADEAPAADDPVEAIQEGATDGDDGNATDDAD